MKQLLATTIALLLGSGATLSQDVDYNDTHTTRVSGTRGADVEYINALGRLDRIAIIESRDVPCAINVFYHEETTLSGLYGSPVYEGSYLSHCNSRHDEVFESGAMAASVWRLESRNNFSVTGLTVCTRELNGRLKGVQLHSRTRFGQVTASHTQNTCRDNWQRTVQCREGYVATGMMVHFAARNRNRPEPITGLQLVCARSTR